jgi:hypothetical protein
MQKWRNWEAAPEADWLLALRRESAIAPLAAQSKVGLRRVNEAALQLDLRRSVIYDLLKRYGRRGLSLPAPLPSERHLEGDIDGQDRIHCSRHAHCYRGAALRCRCPE